MDQLVSVIVPCYNLENEIGPCLESLLRQTHENVELIVVNDGSSDKTLEICQRYARQDSRLRLLDHANRGVSASRNRGLEAANGEYICFVDGDDIVSEDYVAVMLENLLKYDAGISVASYTKQEAQLGQGTGEVSLWDCRETLVNYIQKGDYFPGPVCKLFRRDLIRELRFEENLRIAEDKLFVFQVLERCRTVVFQNTAVYYYYQRPNSAMHAQFDEKFLDAKSVTDRLSRRWKARYPDLADMFEAERISSYARRVQESIRDDSPMSRKLRGVFYEDIKKCRLRQIKPYLPKREWYLVIAEKYCLPILELYEKRGH